MIAAPPRLAIVSTMIGWSWGGSEELWAAAAREATKRGWRVMASVADASAPQHRALRADGVDVRKHLVLMPGSARLQSAASRAISAVRHVERFKPDVLLVSQGAAYDLAQNPVLWRAIAQGALRDTPVVVVCHGNRDEPPPDACRQRALQLFARARALFFVADASLRQARRHLANELPNGAVIRNPVNLPNLDPLEFPAAASMARFASVGRLDAPVKGHDLLFEAFAQDRWRSRQWTLSLYGSGPDASYLRDLARFYGLGDRVEFKGHVSDVREIWRREEILVVASRNEGAPLALVEGMICGRPAVVTRVGGNAEWVTDGASGFIAAAPSADSISDALDRAWANRPRWPEMGQTARRSALKRVDPDPGATLVDALGVASVTSDAMPMPRREPTEVSER